MTECNGNASLEKFTQSLKVMEKFVKEMVAQVEPEKSAEVFESASCYHIKILEVG
jgi:hypothetical protein